MLSVSLLVTVLNDRRGTEQFFRRMEEQTRPPDEIVICDAGSTDGTWEFIQLYARSGRIRTVALQECGCNVARGRNLAARHASYGIFALTDIGCDWEPRWLEELIRPFEVDPTVETVIGSWKVIWENQVTPWAQADYALSHGYEFRASPDSHGTNRTVAHRRELYFRLGGMPEDLTLAGDDSTFARLILRTTNRIAVATEPRCIWERPQTLRALLNETYRNFKADAEAGFGLRHILLSGGRLTADLLITLIFLFLSFRTYPSYMTLLCLLGALAPCAARLMALRRRRASLHRLAHSSPSLHMLALDYLRKLWAIAGYVHGLYRGSRHCQQCRQRLRAVGITWW